MESLRGNINQLIKNTLKMEPSLPVQDPRLIKKEEEEIDWTHPSLQSQPYPEEDMNEEENIEESQSQETLEKTKVSLLKLKIRLLKGIEPDILLLE